MSDLPMPGLPISDLIIRSESPLNAETPPGRLRAAFVTPQRDFYVRSHGTVPMLSVDRYRLRVQGRVADPLVLSMEALREGFAVRTVAAVVQCAGNRRSELNTVRPVKGDLWDQGAIGNAAWTGVSLADVLRAAGADTNRALHVAFEAEDTLPDGTRYGVSIPMSKALDPDVLLAFGMNGEALAPEHGFPLRVVVPGFAGVRGAKWLTGISVQDRPSDCTIQRSDYRLVPPSAGPGAAGGVTINEMPLNAAICEPVDGARLPAGRIVVRGYANATGRAIERVDVSGDSGGSWMQATLESHPDAPWSWTFWEARLDLPPGEHELAVRAWDSAGQTQPASAADVWNLNGYLCAAWHRVRVHAR